MELPCVEFKITLIIKPRLSREYKLIKASTLNLISSECIQWLLSNMKSSLISIVVQKPFTSQGSASAATWPFLVKMIIHLLQMQHKTKNLRRQKEKTRIRILV